MTHKLDAGEKRFLILINRGQEQYEGWAKVSPALFPHVDKMPKELVELERVDDGWGRARLTPDGESILFAMSFL